jgi:3-hexulose-6-phosphate synthase
MKTASAGWTPSRRTARTYISHQGPAAQAVEVALRMLDASVDGVGIHLQVDARRADPTLSERDYLGDVARAVFERVGKTAPVQVVGGLSVAQAKRLAQAGVRTFVISGNLRMPERSRRCPRQTRSNG